MGDGGEEEEGREEGRRARAAAAEARRGNPPAAATAALGLLPLAGAVALSNRAALSTDARRARKAGEGAGWPRLQESTAPACRGSRSRDNEREARWQKQRPRAAGWGGGCIGGAHAVAAQARRGPPSPAQPAEKASPAEELRGCLGPQILA